MLPFTEFINLESRSMKLVLFNHLTESKKLNKTDIQKVFPELDNILVDKDTPKLEMIIAGSAGMILQGYLNRSTEDIDVILPIKDYKNIKPHISEIAKEHDYIDKFLNVPPLFFNRNLLKKFKDYKVYQGNKLDVYSLSPWMIVIMKLRFPMEEVSEKHLKDSKEILSHFPIPTAQKEIDNLLKTLKRRETNENVKENLQKIWSK